MLGSALREFNALELPGVPGVGGPWDGTSSTSFEKTGPFADSAGSVSWASLRDACTCSWVRGLGQNAQLPGLPSLACGQGGWAAAARGLSTSQGPVTFQQDSVLQEAWPLLPSQLRAALSQREGRRVGGEGRGTTAWSTSSSPPSASVSSSVNRGPMACSQ